ncbi:efflux RND transporter periplasmic adaptor subunit [Pseudogracilibacillus sp. SO30301A]|uniref:efflux RND transporter periplasmic adaptor subunit n=1 Tax=Pseudogracilibacillus sp. SO30301A TaxID=3098291 RepID=UPI00300E1D7B
MKKKTKILIGAGVLTLVIVMAVIYAFKGRVSTVDQMDPEEMEVLVQEVTEEKMEETLLVSGKIVAENEQKVYGEPENGEIKEFKVKENDKVKKGDSLFVYNGTELDNELNAAVRSRDILQNNTQATQNQLNQMVNQIEEMKKAKENGQSTDEEGTFITDEDIKSLELEKNQLALEIENAKAEVSGAQAEINRIDEQKKALTVKSKMDGTVVKVNKNLERTEEGTTEPVVHIVSNEPFKVIGTMSEFDSVKIKSGQDVVIRPKVFKDREWKGKVESVSEFPTDEEGGEMDMYGGGDMNVTMYPFKVEITDDTKELRQGYHVSLEVAIGGDEKKLVVPHSALLDDMMMGEEDEDADMMDDMFGMEDGMMEEAPFVYVLIDGVLERRDVETGAMNDEFIEITDGVEVGELVVITPSFEMYDGMEVTSYDEVE